MPDEPTCTMKAKVVGNMPPYYAVAEAIWGRGVDVDSDGDSSTPDATDWRELTFILRPDYEERLDIDPTSEDPDVVVIQATSQDILDRTFKFLEGVGAIARHEC